MKPGFPYKRLGPRTPRLFGFDALWLEPRHLLSVHNKRFAEEYLRFELSEIQAILVRKGARFVLPLYWLISCAAVFATAAAGAAVANGWLAGAGWAVLILLVIYWLAISLFGSCACHLQTATGLYELRGLYRRRAARRALRTLESRITEAQGALPEDWNAPEDWNTDAQLDSASPGTADPESVAASWQRTLLPLLACVALLADALLSWLVRAPNAPRTLRAAGLLVTLFAVVLPVVSIIIFRRDKRFHHIRTMFLIAVFAVGFANYGNTMMAGILTGLRTVRPQPAPAEIGEFFYWVNQIAEVSLGSLGLLQILGDRRGREASAP